MPFDDLTSERTRRLILTLLEEMDPEKYASFFASGTFQGWSMLLLGVGSVPQTGIESLGGQFEKADLEELRDAGYVRLVYKGKSNYEGRLTKRARDAHLEHRRLSHGSKPMVSSGDAELDTLAERLTNRAAAECTTQQVKRIKEL